MFSYSEILEIIEQLEKEEDRNCERFCSMNMGNAVQERKKDNAIYHGAFTELRYRLLSRKKFRERKILEDYLNQKCFLLLP